MEQVFGQPPTEDDLPASQYILPNQPFQELVAQGRGAECQHQALGTAFARRGDKAVGMAMEDSVSKNGKPARPSRKSTRASANHGRSDTTLMRTAREKTFTPRARATHR